MALETRSDLVSQKINYARLEDGTFEGRTIDVEWLIHLTDGNVIFTSKPMRNAYGSGERSFYVKDLGTNATLVDLVNWDYEA